MSKLKKCYPTSPYHFVSFPFGAPWSMYSFHSTWDLTVLITLSDHPFLSGNIIPIYTFIVLLQTLPIILLLVRTFPPLVPHKRCLKYAMFCCSRGIISCEQVTADYWYYHTYWTRVVYGYSFLTRPIGHGALPGGTPPPPAPTIIVAYIYLSAAGRNFLV